VPSSVNILGGTTQFLTWTYSAYGDGTITFSGSASGIDENSGLTKTAVAADVNVVVQTPRPQFTTPVLSGIPSQVSIGQIITLVLGVTNNGLLDATNTTATAYVNAGASSGSAQLLSGPIPVTRTILANGGYGVFTWTFSAAGSGNVVFTGKVASLGEESGVGTSNSITIQTPAALNITYVAQVSPVSVGQQITLVMEVSNSGEAQANNVVASIVPQGDTASISYVSGPNPSSANIAGGASQRYTWIYNTTGTGTVNFYGQASGTDANSGVVKEAVPVTSENIVIETPANLVAGIYAPGTVTIGQWYEVVMVVTNSGQAGAINVSPSALAIGGVGTSIQQGSVVPVSATVGAGESKAFTWTYSASGTGQVTFSGIAKGIDENSGEVKTSGSANGSTIVQKKVNLSVALTASPSVARTGSEITVVAVISNEVGAATAINVSITPQDLGKITTGPIASMVSGPTGAVTIAGGSAAQLTWRYSLDSTAGQISFTGKAIGIDNNTGWSAVSADSQSNTVVVALSASLISEVIRVQGVVSTGQEITIRMSVTNNGGAGATSVTGNALVGYGSGSAGYISGPVPTTCEFGSRGECCI